MLIDGVPCTLSNARPGGYIWQPHHRPAMIRLRRPHRRRRTATEYLGYEIYQRPGYPIWDYNIAKLGSLAHYWDTNLTAAQQAAWAAVGTYPNGFEVFLFQNLCGYNYSPGPSLPILGQNIADSIANGPDFSPCMPFVPFSYPNGPTPSFTLAFVRSDRFTMASVTATHSLDGFVSWYTMYSSRPYNGTRNDNTNPMIRMGICINHSLQNSMFYIANTLTGSETNLAELWNRIIGGAIVGQKIDYGGRRMRLNLNSKPSTMSLHTAIIS